MKRVLKIGLISLHSFLRPGGVKTHILGLQKVFKKLGHKTKVIVPRRNPEENYGRDIILLGTSFPISFGGGKSDFSVNFNPFAIEDVLRKEKFDVLHFHNFSFPSSVQILEKSLALNILTFHSDISRSKFLEEFPIFLYLLQMIVDWRIDGIIGVSSLALKPFKKSDVPKIVIPNGVDLEKFNPKVPKIKKFKDSKINILFVGRIEERKGLIYLLKAYKILQNKFKNLRLIIVGGGELKEKSQNFVKKHNLREVYFEGEKQKEVPSYYVTCDIFCAPSIYGESFGIVLLEAMASGCPIVAFGVPGFKEVLRGKKAEKFMAKPKSVRDLTKKLEILIKNRKLRKEMSRQGLLEVQKYSWEKIAGRVLDFYKLCKKQSKRKVKLSFEEIDKIFEKLAKKDLLDLLR